MCQMQWKVVTKYKLKAGWMCSIYCFHFFKSNKISLHSWVGERISFMKKKKKTQLKRMLQKAKNCWGKIQKPPLHKLTFQVCLWEPSSKGQVWDTCSKTCFPTASGVRCKVIFSAALLVYVNMSTPAVYQTESNWRAEAVSPSWVCLHFLSQCPVLNWYLNMWIFHT